MNVPNSILPLIVISLIDYKIRFKVLCHNRIVGTIRCKGPGRHLNIYYIQGTRSVIEIVLQFHPEFGKLYILIGIVPDFLVNIQISPCRRPRIQQYIIRWSITS